MPWLILFAHLGCASHRTPSPPSADLADFGGELWVGKGEPHLVVLEWYSPQTNSAARADLLPVLQETWCRPDDADCADRFASRIEKAQTRAAEPVEYDVSVWLALGPSSLDRSPDCRSRGITSRTPPLTVVCAGHPTESFTLEQTEHGLLVHLSEDLARGRTPDVGLARADPVAVGFDVGARDTVGSPELAWVGAVAEVAQAASVFDRASVTAALMHRGVDPATVTFGSMRRVVKGMEPFVFRLPMMTDSEQEAVIQETVDAQLR